jgi:thiamine biosynthesis protein ThiS
MTIIVNGTSKTIADGVTIRQLLALLNMVPEKVAIELNKRLARSDKYDLPLKDGDEIEIVTFVGGG